MDSVLDLAENKQLGVYFVYGGGSQNTALLF